VEKCPIGSKLDQRSKALVRCRPRKTRAKCGRTGEGKTRKKHVHWGETQKKMGKAATWAGQKMSRGGVGHGGE